MHRFLRKLSQQFFPWRILREQNRFILNELERLNEMMRYDLLRETTLSREDVPQTQSSFDYQWQEIPEGIAMADDTEFMNRVQEHLSHMTDLPPSWFAEKRVVDVGCGAGRFTYGLLSLKALVTACDASLWALKRTSELCGKFGDRLTIRQINLLDWKEEDDFDLVFCFGVVHHTGNPYLAIRNAASKVRKGGRLFLMVYGFPETPNDFIEINAYEALREELRLFSLAERKRYLVERFGAVQAHGWFDAVSPGINDLLTFGEIVRLLKRLGFENARRTLEGRNHHIVADRA